MIRETLRKIASKRTLASRWKPDASKSDSLAPEKIVWMFGTARTGSTWLSAMMDEIDGYARWHEPLVGHLFGNLYYVRAGHRSKDGNFILGGDKELWMPSIRSFVLDGATRRFPEVVEGDYLIIKEPQGSMGAPLLMEALPESRMILLVRDPRDVTASNLDAHRKGSWTYDLERKGGKEKKETLADSQPDAFVRSQAARYVRDVGNAKKAYDAHEGHKIIVRYEALRGDSLATLRSIYSTLDLPVDDEQLIRAVEKHAWENVPEEEKGEGKFYRKAKPGGWQEDLTSRQAEIVEEVTGSLLKELYPD